MEPNHEHFHTIQHFWADPEWLGNRMLFISGPRQVGKTTLVTRTLCPQKEGYFNWDNRKVRMAFQKDPDFFSGSGSPWICFDEIHKRPKWKDILKGIYDSYRERYRFVVIGSARLDTFRKSGDSLVGRYFHTHLFPLNLPDFNKTDFRLPDDPKELIREAADRKDANEMEPLLELGGFPEPFFSSSAGYWKRWSAQHRELIIREDLRDLSRVIELDKIEWLVPMMGRSIGSTLSYRNLALDLETTHGSIRRWLEMLNKVHLVFSISPYFKNIRRAYRQEKKWYTMDWRASETNRFENYLAASLLRAVTLYGDRYGEKMSLHFVRTHDGAEIDFLLTRGGKPWLLIEAKEGKDIPGAAYRFSRELGVPCIVATRRKNFFKKLPGKEIYCISWSKLGPLLP